MRLKSKRRDLRRQFSRYAGLAGSVLAQRLRVPTFSTIGKQGPSHHRIVFRLSLTRRLHGGRITGNELAFTHSSILRECGLRGQRRYEAVTEMKAKSYCVDNFANRFCNSYRAKFWTGSLRLFRMSPTECRAHARMLAGACRGLPSQLLSR